MSNARQLRSRTSGLSLGAATAAMALAFVLTLVASQPAEAQTLVVIHNFTGGQDGEGPTAGLTLDKAGNLYGTAAGGGAGYGTVYKLTHKGSGWTLNTLYSFAGGSDGANPEARVIFGPNGTLYGTTLKGGAYSAGTVFNLKPPAAACRSALCPWSETVLYSFTGGADGANPEYGDLIFDQAGNIYGTTESGGAQTQGAVYELTPSGSGWKESVLYSFAGHYDDGAIPLNGVIFDNASNLYGTTFEGGVGEGTVFELTPSGSGWIESILTDFATMNSGARPIAGLIFDPSGNLYGATSEGGSGHGGTVFELTPSNGSWTYSLVYSLTGEFGCGPIGTLVMDRAGNLYGTTSCDGTYDAGNVFELTPSGNSWTYTSLYDFAPHGSDGANPYSNVVLDANGNLYGTTGGGGSKNVGVVWEITFP